MQNQNSNRRAKGSAGEKYAQHILEQNGYSLLCKNYTCPGGEVDLIVTKDSHICFVEVKLRSISSGNSAAEAVDNTKFSRINKCIDFFFAEYKDNMYVSSLTPRIDVFEIYTNNGTVKKHNHIIGIQ